MLVGHWPLIGNTNDYSGFNNNGTPTSITYTAGKIGQAASFNGTNSLITTNLTQASLQQEFTISAWVYALSGANYKGVLGDHLNFTGINFCQYQEGTAYFTYGNGSAWITIANISLPLNTWHHVTMVLKTGTGGYGKVYLNGIQQGSTLNNPSSFSPRNSILIGRAFNNSDRYWSGQINDVKVYNHALSDYEVKEIAKAKVLHYTFDDPNEEPTENILSGKLINTTHTRNLGSKSITGWQLTGIANDNPRLFIHSSSIAVSASTNYAFSALYYSSTGIVDDVYLQFSDTGWPEGNIYFQPFLSGQSTTKGGTSTITNLGGGWFYCVGTFLTNAATTTIAGIFFDSDVAGTTVFIGELQLEQKNYATPFTNGIRSIGTADFSGLKYNNFPTTTITPRWSSVSKLGTNSILFNGSASNHLNLTEISAMPFNTGMSFSVWAYPTASSNWARFMDFGAGQASNNILFTRQGTSGNIWLETLNGSTGLSVSVASVIENNVWQHFAFTIASNGVARIYKNGVQIGTGTINVPNVVSRANMYIGRSNWSADSFYNGYMDDIRLYTTELSAADMLALYNRRANFDNLGNVSAGEFLEYTNYDSFMQQNNLVQNGLGELGNNTNFSNFVYQPSFSGFSRTSGSATVFQDDLIPVRGNGLNSFNRYTISAEFRQLTGTASRYYFMIVCYDVNKSFIEHRMVANFSNTRTTLAQPLNNGDTVVHLTSAANWIAGTAGTTAFNKVFAVFNNPLYPIYTYTRLTRNFITVNTSNNTITLQAAWNGGTIPAGTAVANAFDGGTFSYIGASNPLTTTEFVLRQGTSSSSADIGSMRYGSEYIRVGFLLNRDISGTVTTDIRNIRCWNIDDPTQGFFLSTNKNMISDSSQASYTDIDEVTGTLNTNAQQEINRNGTLFINGEFSEVD